jgi:hypothetical protein
MPKHQTDDKELQEVYDHLRHLDGVKDIDGRSSHMTYTATVPVLATIIETLNAVYGPPTKDHPLLCDVVWTVRTDFRISILKAASMDDQWTSHRIDFLSYYKP